MGQSAQDYWPVQTVYTRSVSVQKVILRVELAGLNRDDGISERFANSVEHHVDVEWFPYDLGDQREIVFRQRQVSRGDDHNRCATRRIVPTDLAQDVEPIRIRQIEIEEDKIGGSTACQSQRFLRIPGANRAIALLANEGGDQTPDRGVVLDHQHGLAAGCRGGTTVVRWRDPAVVVVVGPRVGVWHARSI